MSTLVWIGLPVIALAAGGWWWRSRRTGAAPAPVAARVESAAQAGAEASASDGGWALALVELAGIGGDAATADAGACAGAAQVLSRFASEPQRLPRRPQLLPQLLGMLNDDASSARDIAVLIARDPALAANLLKLANSPMYRLQSTPVEGLERAVSLLGTEGVRRMLAVALMQPVMRTEGGLLGELPDRLWEHTQHASAWVVEAARREGVDAFAAQLPVLLQGLGAIVVVQALRDECMRAGQPAPPAVAIASLLQHWSPRIGRLVAREWQLAPALLAALAGQASGVPHERGSLAGLLAQASVEAVARMRDGAAARD